MVRIRFLHIYYQYHYNFLAFILTNIQMYYCVLMTYLLLQFCSASKECMLYDLILIAVDFLKEELWNWQRDPQRTEFSSQATSSIMSCCPHIQPTSLSISPYSVWVSFWTILKLHNEKELQRVFKSSPLTYSRVILFCSIAVNGSWVGIWLHLRGVHFISWQSELSGSGSL